MTRITLAAIVFATTCCILPGCQPAATPGVDDDAESDSSVASSYDEFLEIDEETSPQEIEYLLAAKEFYVAVAEGEFGRAYDLLSQHATQNVHPYQFGISEEAGDRRVTDPGRLEHITKDEFVSQLQKLQARFGPTRDVTSLYVFETEADVLSGKGDRISVMFAIGMMPNSVPAEIRKAGIRGEIRCHFSPEDLEQAVRETGLSAEELQSDEGIYPYFNLKTVLVAEQGGFKVGYFEFLPPSILD